MLTFFLCGTLLISNIKATDVKTLTVQPLSKGTIIIQINQGVIFKGSLAISGGSGNDIDFWITNPEGQTIKDLKRVNEGEEFQFESEKAGAYTLHFDNGFSLLSSKIVTITFNIELQTTSLVFLIIAMVTIFVVAVVVVLLLKRRNK